MNNDLPCIVQCVYGICKVTDITMKFVKDFRSCIYRGYLVV